jgi:ATP-dependent helicase/nuclease subunit B
MLDKYSTNQEIINENLREKFINLDPNFNFIESIGDYVIDNYNSKFSDLKIFLPNSRLSRNLKKYLNNKNIFGTNEIVIKSIAELDISDFHKFLPDNQISQIINELLEIKVLKKIPAIFWLCEEISKNPQFFSQNSIKNFSQKYKIAKTIYELIEELDKLQIDPKKINEIDSFNMAMHQQFTIDFFIDFYISVKNYLRKNNLMFLQEYHNLLCDKFIEVLQQKNISQNIIIAGSTGSIMSSKKLIKTIANYQYGLVILYGYKFLEKYQENHPKYYLNELINFCEVSHKNIKQLINHNHIISNNERQKYIEMIFDDYKNFDVFFSKTQEFLQQKNTIDDILQAIEIYECKNYFEEAKIIAKLCQYSLENCSKIGIICNNQNLSQILKLTLKTYQLNFNDSSSQSIFDTDIIDFLTLLYQVKFTEFNSYNFLAFIKHKFFKKLFNQSIIYQLETTIIRSDRESSDLKGFIAKISNNSLKNFIDKTYQNLPIDKNILSLIKSFEFFCDDNFNNILSNSIAGKEIGDFIDILIKYNFSFASIDDFRILFSDITFFEKFSHDSKIDILNPIEARLLNYDIIFVSSLNENDFPKIDNHGWISGKTKSELGINSSLKKIGQNANDFSNYLSNKKIILTNSSSKLDSINVESHFLTRLKTVNQLLKINLNKNPDILLAEFKNFDKEFFLAPPCPKISIDQQPKSFNITDISRLLENPYEIYVKKILKIDELKPIDYQPEHAEFGSFVHKALEEYVKNPSTNNFDEIFQQYFLSKTAKLIWYPKFLSFFDNFCKDNLFFENCQNILEESIAISLENTTLKGKVDRIILKNNIATIIDYKTGATPSKNKVLSGESPQLLIYAYILQEGLLKNYIIKKLSYWKLNRNDGSNIIDIFDDENAINQAIIDTKDGLKKLFDYFSNPKNGFFATKNLNNDNIKNLSRIEEWNN